MISLLLAVALAAPNYYAKRPPSNRQVSTKAYQIVQLLRKQDRRVLKLVMYHMDWIPKLRYDREKKKYDREKRRQKSKRQQQKEQLNSFDQWYVDMLLDMAGVPKQPRGRK